jgi:hypothetical protein
MRPCNCCRDRVAGESLISRGSHWGEPAPSLLADLNARPDAQTSACECGSVYDSRAPKLSETGLQRTDSQAAGAAGTRSLAQMRDPATLRSVRRHGKTMAGKKVLIVDDAVVMRMMIKNTLSKKRLRRRRGGRERFLGR